MNAPGTAPAARRRRRQTKRSARLLIAALAPIALAGITLAAPAATAMGAATVATTGTEVSGAASAVRPHTTSHPHAPAPRPLVLPGLHASAYIVTLITGDQVRLSEVTPGRYSISAVPAPGDPAINIFAVAKPTGIRSLYAMPAAADALVATGRVDKGLFDLAWLARHGDTRLGAHLSVMLRFGGHQDSPALARAARALPGARLTRTWPATSTAEVSVRARDAAAFWATLSGRAAPAPASVQSGITRRGSAIPPLASGVVRVWLAGHQSAPANPPRPADGQPLYTVTETISGLASRANFTMAATDFVLVGLTGAGADNVYPAAGISCVTANPCATAQVTYTVPAGVYTAFGQGGFVIMPRLQWVDLADPQFTVAGDTRISLDMNAARQVSISTPRPSDRAALAYQDYRTLPDGTYSTSLSLVFYGYQYLWAVPTTAPVTIGTYHFSSAWFLDAPPITMSVAAPHHLTLHATYQSPTNVTTPELGPLQFTRFAGRQTLPLVDVGIGRPQDFAHLNVRGKLVLVSMDPAIAGCIVMKSQLMNARRAGAAGVIVAARIPGGSSCLLPIQGSWMFPGYPGFGNPAPAIPFADISASEAAALDGLLAHGPVRVTVTDSGPTPYLYDLKFYQEGRIPGDLHYTVTRGQLADVATRYHSATQAEASPDDSVAGLNEYFVGGLGYALPEPDSLHIFVGPVSPDVVHWRDSDQHSTGPLYYTFDVFGQRGETRTENWFDQPEVPGAAAAPTDVYQAQPGKWTLPGYATLCSFCRQGTTFYPLFYPQSATDPRLIINAGMEDFDPSSIHLYRGSSELHQSLLLGQYPVYQLPAGQARYRLTTAYTAQESPASTVETTWQFTSARPAADHTPSGYACVGTILGSSAPCNADPLILLHYNGFVDLSNAVTASTAHQLGVTAYYQATNPAAAVTSLKLWTSTDGGTTWHRAVVTGHDGSFTATYQVPPLSATSGTVSIRVQASDSAGNTVAQTILNAYTLTT